MFYMHVCQAQKSVQILHMAWSVNLAKALRLSIALSRAELESCFPLPRFVSTRLLLIQKILKCDVGVGFRAIMFVPNMMKADQVVEKVFES